MTRGIDTGRVVHALVDAIGDHVAMTSAVQEVGAALGANGGQVFLLRPDGELVENLAYAGEGARDAFAEYDAHWRARDPRFAIAMARPGAVYSDVEVIAPDAFDRSAIYNEFLAHCGVRYPTFPNIV
jgi:hypothetical protein